MAKAMVCDRDTAESTLRRLLPVGLTIRSNAISAKCSHFMIERGRERVADFWNTTGRLSVIRGGLWDGLSPEVAAEYVAASVARCESLGLSPQDESESGDMFPQCGSESGERIDFGQHKGERWADVPSRYLLWIVRSHLRHRDAKSKAKSELSRRRQESESASRQSRQAMIERRSEWQVETVDVVLADLSSVDPSLAAPWE